MSDSVIWSVFEVCVIILAGSITTNLFFKFPKEIWPGGDTAIFLEMMSKYESSKKEGVLNNPRMHHQPTTQLPHRDKSLAKIKNFSRNVHITMPWFLKKI